MYIIWKIRLQITTERWMNGDVKFPWNIIAYLQQISYHACLNLNIKKIVVSKWCLAWRNRNLLVSLFCLRVCKEGNKKHSALLWDTICQCYFLFVLFCRSNNFNHVSDSHDTEWNWKKSARNWADMFFISSCSTNEEPGLSLICLFKNWKTKLEMYACYDQIPTTACRIPLTY